MAERTKFPSYLVYSFLVSALIYPVFGSLSWSNLFLTDNVGFLANLGFIDFAGSTVVHSIGGWIALAGTIVLGTLSVGLLAAPLHGSGAAGFFYGGRFKLLGVQALGVGLGFLWAFGTGLLLFFLLKITIGLRVTYGLIVGTNRLHASPE